MWKPLNAATLEKTEQRREQAHEVAGAARLVLWLGGCIIRLWCRTLRMRADEASRAALGSGGPAVFLLWHNRLFMAAEVYRRFIAAKGRRMHGLISGSKDGAWLAGVFKAAGIDPIRGSSSWRATEALRQVVRVLREGDDVGITPDGPRGPCYSFQRGALLAAKTSGVPIVLIGIAPSRVWQLKSWDRFRLPVPFSRVQVQSVRFSSYDELVQAAGENTADHLRVCLLELSQVDDAAEPPA